MGKFFPLTADSAGFGTDYTKAKFHKPIDMRNFPFAPIGPSYDMVAGMEDYNLPRNIEADKLKRYACMVGKCKPEETLSPNLNQKYPSQTPGSKKVKKGRLHPWDKDPTKKKF